MIPGANVGLFFSRQRVYIANIAMIILRETDALDPLNREKMTYKTRDGKPVSDPAALAHIASLVVPPAYSDVVIHYDARGTPKILYTGVDDAGRTQSIYSKQWSAKQSKLKLCDLIEFGRVLPVIQSDMRRYMQNERFTRNRVISIMISVIERCNIRIGQEKNVGLYQSYGVTTLLKSHLKIDTHAHLDFIGKKSMQNQCTIDDPVLVESLRALVAAHPHSNIFAYQLDGIWQEVSSSDVNNWLKSYGSAFSSKMFRTFSANVKLVELMRDTADPTKLKRGARKKEVVRVVRAISEKIHNTPAICKKAYIDSDILDLYVDKPRAFRSQFMTNRAEPRLVVVAWLKRKCNVRSDTELESLASDIRHERDSE